MRSLYRTFGYAQGTKGKTNVNLRFVNPTMNEREPTIREPYLRFGEPSNSRDLRFVNPANNLRFPFLNPVDFVIRFLNPWSFSS